DEWNGSMRQDYGLLVASESAVYLRQWQETWSGTSAEDFANVADCAYFSSETSEQYVLGGFRPRIQPVGQLHAGQPESADRRAFAQLFRGPIWFEERRRRVIERAPRLRVGVNEIQFGMPV